jgi:Lar family restriction alleviation protein
MIPCPFCGWKIAKAPVEKEYEGPRYYVLCRSCLAFGPLCNTKKSALEHWNERATLRRE